MLVIEAHDAGQKPVFLTVSDKGQGTRREVTVSLYKPKSSASLEGGHLAGERLGSIVLAGKDIAELKKSL